jgi:hypothetical protein
MKTKIVKIENNNLIVIDIILIKGVPPDPVMNIQ